MNNGLTPNRVAVRVLRDLSVHGQPVLGSPTTLPLAQDPFSAQSLPPQCYRMVVASSTTALLCPAMGLTDVSPWPQPKLFPMAMSNQPGLCLTLSPLTGPDPDPHPDRLVCNPVCPTPSLEMVGWALTGKVLP